MNIVKKSLAAVLMIFNLIFFYGCEPEAKGDDDKKEQSGKKKAKVLPEYEYGTEQALLWEISGNGLAHKSYLYGTIHIQMKEVFQYDDVVLELFEYCDAFSMETLLDEVPMGETMAAMKMKDTTLQDLLTEEEYARLEVEFKAVTGVDVSIMNDFKPFFLSAQMTLISLPKDMPEALDMHFLKMAREDKSKKVFGLEEFMDEVNAIDQISLKDQAKMMMDGLDSTGIMSKEKLAEMLEAYLVADLETLNEATKDSMLPPEFEEALLVKRNYKMADKVEEYAKAQSTFNAMGAAHLTGEVGIVTLLREKGYEVKPIKTKFKEGEE
jgi:uncharacterized protein YbaP (TraB family)